VLAGVENARTETDSAGKMTLTRRGLATILHMMLWNDSCDLLFLALTETTACSRCSDVSFCTALWTCGAYPDPRMIGDACHFVPGAHSPRRLNGANCQSGSLSRFFTGGAVGRHGHTPSSPQLASLLSPAKAARQDPPWTGLEASRSLSGGFPRPE
jgi:hypothetical protein